MGASPPDPPTRVSRAMCYSELWKFGEGRSYEENQLKVRHIQICPLPNMSLHLIDLWKLRVILGLDNFTFAKKSAEQSACNYCNSAIVKII